MRYTVKKGETYVENGPSKVRVGLQFEKPYPEVAGYTVRVFQVLEVLKESEGNDIQRGQLIALNFPNDKLSAKEFVWPKSIPRQVKMTVPDKAPVAKDRSY